MKLHGSFGDEYEDNDLNKKLYRLIPSQTQDIIATALLLVVLPLGVLLHLFYVLSTWFPAFGEAWVIRTSILLFFAFNLYSNWFFMVRVGPSGRNTILPNVVKAGFRYCHACHTNAPPRAHHCPVCDVCVLRRDHHCSFGAVCVGHFNQRYFVAAAINLWLLVAPLVSYDWSLMSSKLDGGITAGRFWQIMLPHVAFITRFLTWSQFIHVVLFVFTFTVLMFATYLLAAQIFCLVKGQTRVEYLMDIHAYQLGFLENLRQSLGARWPFIALSCFIPSPLPSNGMSFATRELESFNSKDL
ncbi:unnamed protein product [Caenorhabditis auriculariae]|uniref:Palmitoyltransferase n=1 Tax=Caenorhabditis auriculariae TaxID=2777116 RepID=A0A8S1H0S1_9PELO|nr:unnamed protein product [Caenorhabditis auriculariae]